MEKVRGEVSKRRFEEKVRREGSRRRFPGKL